jgi:hypothetical protein
MAFILQSRIGILFVLLKLGAFVAVEPLDQLDANSNEARESESLLVGTDSPDLDVGNDSPDLDVHSEDPEAAAEDSLPDPPLDSVDAGPQDVALNSAGTNSQDLVDDYSNSSQNLMTDMFNDVVQDVVNDVTSVAFLAPEKGDAVPAFPVTFPGCSCKWNEPGYSCESDILAPDSVAGQPCCCCGLKCLQDHRCSDGQCLLLGYDQQKEIEDEEKRLAAELNRTDVTILGEGITGYTVSLGKGQCTNKRILERCNELGLTPVCDHSSYAGNAKVCWTNMQPHHWSQLTGRNAMKQKKFDIPEEFDEKSMGMCFFANYPHPWALAPNSHTLVWTNTGTGLIQPLKKGSYGYKGPTTPSSAVTINKMNDCSSELGCWRTLCVKKDPCSNCASCGNPCGPCGTSNCPKTTTSSGALCINGKTMVKKYQAKWPHCTNLGGCFGGRTWEDRVHACLSNPSCNGFSFTHRAGDEAPATGGGCLKHNCDPERNGYGYRSHDYWVKQDCTPAPAPAPAPSSQPQCASAAPSSSHLLVSGAWPCVKTGAPCKKVQTTAPNGLTSKSGMGMENSHIGVTCCDAKGVGTRPSCRSGVTFDQAVNHCKSHGLDLCTAEQIKAGSGEATGCRFDHGLVWTCSAR